MGDLLKYAKLERDKEQLDRQEKELASQQKYAASLRESAITSVRKILPKEIVWDVKAGGTKSVRRESRGSTYDATGLEVTVDEIVFIYTNDRWSGNADGSIWLERTCAKCDGQTWVGPIQKLTDIAFYLEQEINACPSCSARSRVTDPDVGSTGSKKHSLQEHIRDFDNWLMETSGGYYSSSQEQRQANWFVAYERWTNDKPLLSEEEG